MSDSEFNYTTMACGRCNLAMEDQDGLVACDCCKRRFHRSCVGVIKTTKKWYCGEVACQQAAKEKKSRKKKKDPANPEDSDASSVISTASQISLEEQVKAMEEEQRKFNEELEKQKILQRKRMEMENAMKRTKFLHEQDLRRQQMELDDERQNFEFAEKESEQQQLLKAKQDHLERIREQEKRFREQMLLVDQQLAKFKTDRDVDGKEKDPGGDNVDANTPLRNPGIRKQEKGRTANDGSDEDSDSDSDSSDAESDEESEVEDSQDKVQQEQSPASKGTSKKRSGPTKAQLAARHGIGKFLPQFSGNPENWPLFYAAYRASTKACGYSNIDNLARLQQCLKGDALELVQGQLLLPKTVPRVMKKLRQNFGRPEQLLGRLLERVEGLPAPKNLKGFLPFANVVEQLCDHVEAAGLKEHLRNPLLINDLVRKLPDTEKRQWVDVKRARGKKRITLRTLADFLIRIADDAREANVDIESTEKSETENHPIRKKTEGEEGAVHFHSEGEMSSTNDIRYLRPCKVCQRTDHRLRFCQAFKQLALPERIAVVERHKLCRLCLGEHGGQCRHKFRCNVGDCNERHNPLIHSVTADLSAHIGTKSDLLFRMIPLILHCRERTLKVLALIDEGASVTLIEEKLADQLGAVGEKEGLTIRWTADHTRIEPNSRKMNLWASATGSEGDTLLKTIRTVGKLQLPHQKLDAAGLQASYPYMRGLPIESYEGRPQMLIGLNNIYPFAPWEVKRRTAEEPIAACCDFGWTVYGSYPAGTAVQGDYVCSHQELFNDSPRSNREEAAASSTIESTATAKVKNFKDCSGKSHAGIDEGTRCSVPFFKAGNSQNRRPKAPVQHTTEIPLQGRHAAYSARQMPSQKNQVSDAGRILRKPEQRQGSLGIAKKAFCATVRTAPDLNDVGVGKRKPLTKEAEKAASMGTSSTRRWIRGSEAEVSRGLSGIETAGGQRYIREVTNTAVVEMSDRKSGSS